MENRESNRIEMLKDFIEKYAIEFLEGCTTKDDIVNGLKNGDINLALEILNCIDESWVERTKEIGICLVFEDSESVDQNGNKITKPFYKANYMDSLEYKQQRIPTLRYVKARYIPKEYRRDENER